MAAPPACWAAPTRRTARPSTRPGWPAAWPTAVRRAGVQLYERTPVLAIEPRRVMTPAGTVCARYVVRATEGYTPQLPGLRAGHRAGLLADDRDRAAAAGGLGPDRPGRAADLRRLPAPDHLRAADGGRPAGLRRPGRAVPFRLRGPARVRPGARGLRGAAPDAGRAVPGGLGDAEITHRWGGPLGIARDWCASVGLDPETGLGWAGGYVGDGVSTTNLAGRTLADLITGRGQRAGPAAVGRAPVAADWEPEPLRWLGLNAGLRVMNVADREEERTGQPSRVARLMERFLGA